MHNALNYSFDVYIDFNVNFVDDKTCNHTIHSYARNPFPKEAVQVTN